MGHDAAAPATEIAIARPTWEQMTLASNVAMLRLRKRRERDFDRFRDLAGRFFRAPPSDAAHVRMGAMAGFFVGDAAGLNARAARAAGRLAAGAEADEDVDAARRVEVFYGARAVRSFLPAGRSCLRAEASAPVETGASLLYRQGDDGAVTVYLYPAAVDGLRAEEDAIEIARYDNLSKMTGAGVLEAHWRAFRAYAETTSVDGAPTLADRTRVAWLRFSRPVIRAGRRHRREAEAALRQSAGVLLGVALALLAVGALA